VLTISRVNVDGSEEPGTQVIVSEEVRSTVVPEKGEVNVSASDVVAKARREVRRIMLAFSFVISWMASVRVSLWCFKRATKISYNSKSGQHLGHEAQLWCCSRKNRKNASTSYHGIAVS